MATINFTDGSVQWQFEPETEQELRQHFQALTDREYGRWRDPVYPSYVVYPRPDYPSREGERGIRIINEIDGDRFTYYESIDRAGGTVQDSVADRYFATHPAPKPWLEAKFGEVWVLACGGGDGMAYLVDEDGDFISVDGAVIRKTSASIQEGNRLWPEGDDA